MLGNAGGDSEDIGIEDDVLGRKPVGDQQFVGASADVCLARITIGLPLFVESHDDHGSAEPVRLARLDEEFFLALLHRNRVDNTFALAHI